jgi:hypothetical protein
MESSFRRPSNSRQPILDLHGLICRVPTNWPLHVLLWHQKCRLSLGRLPIRSRVRLRGNSKVSGNQRSRSRAAITLNLSTATLVLVELQRLGRASIRTKLCRPYQLLAEHALRLNRRRLRELIQQLSSWRHSNWRNKRRLYQTCTWCVTRCLKPMSSQFHLLTPLSFA